MKTWSLRLRLLAASVLSLALALTATGLAFMLLFERHLERRLDRELTSHLRQLARHLEIRPDGALELIVPLADPRFEEPLSGLYWQVESASGRRLASRSLWRSALPPLGDKASPSEMSEIDGPNGETLLVRWRPLLVETASGAEVPLTLIVGVKREELAVARGAFALEIVAALALLAAVLLGAAALQIFVGLRPLSDLTQRVNAVRTGAASRLEGRHPGEVRPLVNEVNALLAANGLMVGRARDAAADLAHGLKTPLAVLGAECNRLVQAGQSHSAAEISDQIEAMRQRIDRHLALVRLKGGAPTGKVDVRAALEKLLRAMKATARGEQLRWELSAPDEIALQIDIEDFYEVFGNLLENASKWARSRVEIQVVREGEGTTVVISDDGPGLPAERIGEALERGGRLDEAKPGTGLGLAIVRRVLEAYGASLSLQNGPHGGACAIVRFSEFAHPSST